MPEALARLVEPAALIGLALVFLVLVARRSRNRTTLALSAATLVVYLGMSTPLGANWMVGLLEHHPSAARTCGTLPPGAMIVVLAGGINRDATSPADTSRLSAASLRRAIAAASAAKDAPSGRILVSGGSGIAVREADLMRILLLDLGIAPDRVAVERDSRNTYENAVLTRKWLSERWPGEKRIFLVTSAAHLPRATAVFRKVGLDVCPLPADTRWDPPEHATDLIPAASALQKSATAFHEGVALLGYWVAGRI
jgi:uncharacterized SAM-binding protein YcdF (DUF218 family)